jgi:hypothetical protein
MSIGNWKQSGAKIANKTLQLTQKASITDSDEAGVSSYSSINLQANIADILTS